MPSKQRCTGCNEFLPLTREHFGATPTGGFRKRCRRCMAAKTKTWAENNPERLRQRETRRQKLNDGFVITDDLKLQLLKEQNHLCALCGLAIVDLSDCEVDHLIPVAKGGSHRDENLVAAHRRCNREKHAKSLRQYVQWRQLNGLPPSTYSDEKIKKALA
jgi:5-methylcytosine-specific restriction endonuclease McrA